MLGNTSKKLWIASGVLLVLLGLVTRFYQLTLIPTSLAHDEMIYAVHALSVSQTGSDLSGTWNPLSLTPVHPMFAELPALFQSVFYFLPVSPILAARMPFVVLSLLLPVLIAAVSWELFRNKVTAFLTGALALFNPWIWQFGRMGFDSYWSVFLYTLGGYLLLRLRSWKKLWAALPLFLGFYQYQGHKLALIPWIAIFVGLLVWNNAKVRKIRQATRLTFERKEIVPAMAVLALAVLLFVVYTLVQLPQQGSSERLSTLVTPNSPEIILKVNERRQLSLSSPLNVMIVNKYTVWSEEMLRKYAEIFNPEHLFLNSQYSGFNVWSHGLFYLVDLVLILFGTLYLWKRNLGFIGGVTSLGLLAVVIAGAVGGGNSYLFRTSLSIPLLLLLIGLGFSYLWGSLPTPFRGALIGVYAVSIGLFTYEYFVRYPVYSAERTYFADRVLSRYIQLADNRVLVYSDEPDFTYTALVFYNNLFRTENKSLIQNQYKDRTFTVSNFSLTDECVPQQLEVPSDTTVIVRSSAKRCDPEEGVPNLPSREDATSSAQLMHKIGAVRDSGMVYEIFNDTVCSADQPAAFMHIQDVQDFDLGRLSAEEFCSNWIMK